MAFAPSSSGLCACAAHEPLPTRATKAVVKKSGKIAEASPSAAVGWKPSIFLDFEGARTPALERGERHHGWCQQRASSVGNWPEAADSVVGPRKSVNDVEIWFAQKAGLFWFLRSNTKIERFLSSRKATPSENDFFNRIGQRQPLKCKSNLAQIHRRRRGFSGILDYTTLVDISGLYPSYGESDRD